MTDTLLEHERQHLAQLLGAIQRCVYFLDAASSGITWPLFSAFLQENKKSTQVFGGLAAINERFSKLQDTLALAMRHALILMSEPADTFLKSLAFYEKVGVIDSVSTWQTCRAARNLAAHDYETDYLAIAEHFNALHELRPEMYRVAKAFLKFCEDNLGIAAASADLSNEFNDIVSRS